MFCRQIFMGTLVLVGGIGFALGQPAGSQNAASPYASTASRYPSTAPPNAHKKQAVKKPAETAALRQSGLSDAQVRTLLRRGGYNSVIDLHAEPNSIWVWQADAMKNGRRVRIGIDYRGHMLELSGGFARPCVSPGAGFTAGPLGAGSRLSTADRCAGR